MSLVKLPPCIHIVLIFFHILVLLEHRVLTESRIPLKPVLGGVKIAALVLMNRLNKTESALFLCCRFSLFLKDSLFQIIYRFSSSVIVNRLIWVLGGRKP